MHAFSASHKQGRFTMQYVGMISYRKWVVNLSEVSNVKGILMRNKSSGEQMMNAPHAKRKYRNTLIMSYMQYIFTLRKHVLNVQD